MKTTHEEWKLFSVCETCKGKGADPHDKAKTCPTCKGSGVIRK